MPAHTYLPPRKYFASLAGSEPIELGTRNFATNNFFNLTAARSKRNSFTPYDRLTAATPVPILLSQIIKSAMPKEMPYEPIEDYIEGRQWPIYRAAINRNGVETVEAESLAAIPPQATILRILGEAQMFLDAKYAAIYEDKYQESRRLGLFVVSQSLEPSHPLPQPG